jgi:hypothetical protein
VSTHFLGITSGGCHGTARSPKPKETGAASVPSVQASSSSASSKTPTPGSDPTHNPSGAALSLLGEVPIAALCPKEQWISSKSASCPTSSPNEWSPESLTAHRRQLANEQVSSVSRPSAASQTSSFASAVRAARSPRDLRRGDRSSKGSRSSSARPTARRTLQANGTLPVAPMAVLGGNYQCSAETHRLCKATLTACRRTARGAPSQFPKRRVRSLLLQESECSSGP